MQFVKWLLGDLRAWIVAGIVLGIVVWVFVFPVAESRNAARLESDQAPLIAELEHYRLKNGKYPETLDSLVPEYLAELPPCPISHRPGYYVDPGSGRYELICPTFMFSQRTYDPAGKSWRLSMD